MFDNCTKIDSLTKTVFVIFWLHCQLCCYTLLRKRGEKKQFLIVDLNSLVNCNSRSQNSKLHLAWSQSLSKWFIHFKSRSIETLTALTELLCKFETNF